MAAEPAGPVPCTSLRSRPLSTTLQLSVVEVVSATFSGKPVTYTCTPPGSGFRLGVDRDADGYRDGDERLAHSDPSDPNDTP